MVQGLVNMVNLQLNVHPRTTSMEDPYSWELPVLYKTR